MTQSGIAFFNRYDAERSARRDAERYLVTHVRDIQRQRATGADLQCHRTGGRLQTIDVRAVEVRRRPVGQRSTVRLTSRGALRSHEYGEQHDDDERLFHETPPCRVG